MRKSYITLLYSLIFISCDSEEKMTTSLDRNKLVTLISEKIAIYVDSAGHQWTEIKVPIMHSSDLVITDTIISGHDTTINMTFSLDSTLTYKLENEFTSINFDAQNGHLMKLWSTTIFKSDSPMLILEIQNLENETFKSIRSREIKSDTLWVKPVTTKNVFNAPNYCLIYNGHDLVKLIYFPVLLN